MVHAWMDGICIVTYDTSFFIYLHGAFIFGNHELRYGIVSVCSSGERWEEDTGLDGESVSNQSHGEDLESLLADSEYFYGQAYYRYLAIQRQTREDIEGALPSLGQASTAPEQVQGVYTQQ